LEPQIYADTAYVGAGGLARRCWGDACVHHMSVTSMHRYSPPNIMARHRTLRRAMASALAKMPRTCLPFSVRARVHSRLILYVAGRDTVSIRSNLTADGQMLTPLILDRCLAMKIQILTDEHYFQSGTRTVSRFIGFFRTSAVLGCHVTLPYSTTAIANDLSTGGL